jgi:bacterioferritin (cytochrome b1)
MTLPQFYKAIVQLYNQVLFQPAVLREYLRRYRLSQIWKLTAGTYRVRRQYIRKMKEAKNGASRKAIHA